MLKTDLNLLKTNLYFEKSFTSSFIVHVYVFPLK